MEDGRIGDEMTLAGIAKQLEGIREDLTAVRSDIKAVQSDVKAVQSDVKSHDGKLQSLDGRFQSLDGKLTALDHKMTIEFEETRRVVKLGFESVEMLDEKIDRRFDDTDRAHADHKLVLEAALVSLRRDTSKPRRPGRRR